MVTCTVDKPNGLCHPYPRRDRAVQSLEISRRRALARRLVVDYPLYASRPSILIPLADTVAADGKRRLSDPEYPAQKRHNLEEGMCGLLYCVVVGITLEDQPIGLPSGSGSWQPLPLPHRKWVQSRNNRRNSPFSMAGLPKNCGFDVRLFHPAFENFSRRYRGAEELASDDAAPVHEFLVRSAGYYDTEETRQRVVTPILEKLLRREILDTWNPDATSADGTILFIPSGTPVPTLLFELKNEIGSGDADATHQVGLLYRKFWSQKRVYRLSLFGALTHKPIRIPRAAPAAAPHSYWLSWDRGYVCLARCSPTSISSSP